MTDAFNNYKQQDSSLEKSKVLPKDVSLEDVQDLPAVFERVMESQKSFNHIEAKGRLADVSRELSALQAVVAEYQRQLAEKVIKTGEVSQVDQSRGAVLLKRQVELVTEKEELAKAIKRAKKVRTAIGHLVAAGAILKSVETTQAPDIAEEFEPLVILPIKDLHKFAPPLEKYSSTTTLDVDLPPILPDDTPADEEVAVGWQELDDVEISDEVRKLFPKNKLLKLIRN